MTNEGTSGSPPPHGAGSKPLRDMFCSIMFADVVRASDVVVDEQKIILKIILDSHLEMARARPNHIFSKHLGDGILVCLSRCSDLAEIALKLREDFRTTDWRRRGFSRHIEIRIGLDLQMVTLHGNANGDIIDGSGAGLDHAARVEPITLPNRVFCTELFYNGVRSERVTNISGDNLGLVELAKNSGEEILYSLKWTHEEVTAQLHRNGDGGADTTNIEARPRSSPISRPNEASKHDGLSAPPKIIPVPVVVPVSLPQADGNRWTRRNPVAIYFLAASPTRVSEARREWQALKPTRLRELIQISAYLGDVDRGAAVPPNIALSQAVQVRASPLPLFCWQFNGLSVHFVHDGTDTVIVMLKAVANPHVIPSADINEAEGRL